MRVMFSQNFIPSQRLSPNFQGKLKNDSKAQVSKGTQSPIQNNASSLDNVKTGQSTGVIGDAIAQAYLSRVGAFIGYAESFHLALKTPPLFIFNSILCERRHCYKQRLLTSLFF